MSENDRQLQVNHVTTDSPRLCWFIPLIRKGSSVKYKSNLTSLLTKCSNHPAPLIIRGGSPGGLRRGGWLGGGGRQGSSPSAPLGASSSPGYGAALGALALTRGASTASNSMTNLVQY